MMTVEEAQKKYTRIVKIDDKWNAYLQLGVQGFCIVQYTTKKRALWFTEMMAIALCGHFVEINKMKKEQPMFLVKLESGTIGYVASMVTEPNRFFEMFENVPVELVLYNDTGEVEYTESGKLLEVLK